MSTRCTDIVWQELDVKGQEKLLLLAIADISNHEGDNIHPSDEYLVWLTGISLRNVRYMKAYWKEIGALLPVENEKGGRGNYVRYELNLSVFPRKTEWEGKGARAASLRKRQERIKGARAASFENDKGCNPEHERVQDQTVKGASGDMKGCKTAQRNKEEPLLNQNLTVRGNQNQMPPSPVIVIAREKLAEHIQRNGPYPGDPDYDRKMFHCILAGRGGLSPTHVKEFLSEDAEWRRWPYLELLDSQQEIIFPDPPPRPQPQSVEEIEQVPWWHERLSPERYEKAKAKALEYLATKAAKQSVDQVRRELGTCLGTVQANAVDEFIVSIQRLEATA